MKRISILIACIMLMLVIAGCGGGAAAKRVVAEENIAAMDLDAERAKQYFTQRYIDEHPDRFIEMSQSYGTWKFPVPPEQRPSVQQIMDHYDCTVRGATAIVRPTEEYRDVYGNVTITLILVGGSWKIDKMEWPVS